MKIYDIVLGVARALVLIALIREAATLLFALPRAMLVLAGSPAPGLLRVEELSSIAQPFYFVIVNLIILALCRPIARLATRFATAQDAAAPF